MELLAPAGNRDALHAAIENGADAVYLGGKNFSARQSAENFSDEDIARALEYARSRNRKIYVAVNTLIDDEEFGPALDYAWNLHMMDIDALIVQDLGFMDALHQVIPAMKVHASTQMTIHNSEGVHFLEKQGIKRVVMSREMQMEDIQAVKQTAQNIELEVFVHGALCFSYSGQCLFSSMVGGRSGNRGRCAQPCRLPYDLYSISSAQRISTPDKGRYLLSPSDLCLIEYLPELKAIGVDSLKIEGRMKRAEYVAVVTRAYREVLDMLQEEPFYRPANKVRDKLLKIFNRNFTSGHFIFDRSSFLSSKRPNNRGVYVGRVVAQDKDYGTTVKLNDSVSLGDGLEIWVNKGKNPTFVVNNMKIRGLAAEHAQPGDTVEFRLDKRVSPQDRIFKTHDEELISEALLSMKGAEEQRIRVDIKAVLEEGQPLKLILTDEKGHQIEEISNNKARRAENQPLNESILKSKIDRMGNTPYYLGDFEFQSDADLILPFSEINETRRRAVQSLKRLSLNLDPKGIQEEETFRRNRAKFIPLTKKGRSIIKPELTITVSGIDQAYAAIKTGADIVYFDLAGIGQKKRISIEELEGLKQYSARYLCQVIPALPRIQKPGEASAWLGLKAAGFNTIMAGNIGALNWSLNNGINSRVDYSFNVFNSYSLRFLVQQGVERACVSPELNYNCLKNIRGLNLGEVIVHGELILMTSQYCMLQGVLGDATDRCQGFCHQDRYAIKDDLGYSFPIETDTYCRFYVFNSRTLCMIDDLDKIIALRPGGLRIEARHAQEREVEMVVRNYRRAIDDILNGSKKDLQSYRSEIEKTTPSPFTRGHYYRGVI
ncbi:protease [hydrocarbon metagenome]|uniref:Protease n=1 Tax=hydrocarbon metagenome TaxID=938273 RepID=A0A0W8E5W2_9ZZZZ